MHVMPHGWHSNLQWGVWSHYMNDIAEEQNLDINMPELISGLPGDASIFILQVP